MFGSNTTLEAIRGRPSAIIYATTSGSPTQAVREVLWDQAFSDWYRLQNAPDLQVNYVNTNTTTDTNTYTSTSYNLSFTETIVYTDTTKTKRSTYTRVKN